MSKVHELISGERARINHALFIAGLYLLIFVIFFSPSLLRGYPLAVGGDGLYIYLPNFYSRKVFWDTFIFAGFPMLADPQVATWYPPAFLLSLLPHTWNIFMLLGYVAGSSFMYGYVHSLTQSRLAAFVSGLVFGLSGFMIAHLGHAVIIHAAAWIPLALWSVEELRRGARARWFVSGVLAIALSFLGGHSQIFFYGLLLTIAYALVGGWNISIGRLRFYSIIAAMIALAIALTAVQFIPTAELVRQGGRASFSFQDFVSHSMPPRQALTLIFPNVFGTSSDTAAVRYFGAENRTELAGFVGLLPLLLATVGVIADRRRRLTFFWLAIAIIAIILAMGDGTPLARVIYDVPLLNSFRAPSRHFLESTIAFSVLAGLGIAAVADEKISKRQLRRVLIVATAAILICLCLLLLNVKYMISLAAEQNIRLTLKPWANSAVAVPLLMFVIAVAMLVYWSKHPASPARILLLIGFIVIDLGSFGWFHDWRYFPSQVWALKPPEFANRYRTLLEPTQQRLIPYRSARGTLDEMPPNLTRLWGVPSAGGYNVLVLSRISNLLPMIDHPQVPLPWAMPEDRGADVLAIRYLVVPQNQIETDALRKTWFNDRMELWLGSGCGQAPRKQLKFTLPHSFRSTSLSIISRLACSSFVPDQTPIARVNFISTTGEVISRDLLAGRDSSEWAADCAQVATEMRHQKAMIYSSFPASMHDQQCPGHYYLTTLFLNAPRDIKQLEIESIVPAPSSFVIEKMTLENIDAKTSLPIESAAANDDWRLIEDTEKRRVFENLRAMPRVWLVSDIRAVSEPEALEAVKTSRLKDGSTFDPRRIAIVEGLNSSVNNQTDPNAMAGLVEARDDRMVVQTSASQPAFLLTSDSFYPGWVATIDGARARVYRADYGIRGVFVPAGTHLVRLEVRPRSFYAGALISVLALLVTAMILGSDLRSRNSHSERHSQ